MNEIGFSTDTNYNNPNIDFWPSSSQSTTPSSIITSTSSISASSSASSSSSSTSSSSSLTSSEALVSSASSSSSSSLEADDYQSNSYTFDSSSGGSFLNFVPPPPRPIFLDDEHVTPDGVTTCDLCSWAWKDGKNSVAYDGLEASGELGWVLTLVIVSLSSALIGAVIMIIVLHCKSRLKNSSVSETECGISLHHQQITPRPPLNRPDDKEISTITPAAFPSMPSVNMPTNNNGVWSWLAKRNTNTSSNLNNPPSSHVENHYTHMEDQYNAEEALYAELDRDNSDQDDRDSNSPAYQNSAYTDTDAPTSSAPSSAYYSDLSVTTMPERPYEVVGLTTLPSSWDSPIGGNNNNNLNNGGCDSRRPIMRLAVINENVGGSVPSDYV